MPAMGADLASLEGLVDRAVRRLGELGREKRALEAEASELRARLAEGDAAATAAGGWRRERDEIRAELGRALAELREGL
jgi:hypothetical protein